MRPISARRETFFGIAKSCRETIAAGNLERVPRCSLSGGRPTGPIFAQRILRPTAQVGAGRRSRSRFSPWFCRVMFCQGRALANLQKPLCTPGEGSSSGNWLRMGPIRRLLCSWIGREIGWAVTLKSFWLFLRPAAPRGGGRGPELTGPYRRGPQHGVRFHQSADRPVAVRRAERRRFANQGPGGSVIHDVIGSSTREEGFCLGHVLDDALGSCSYYTRLLPGLLFAAARLVSRWCRRPV